MTATNLDIRTL